MNTADVLAWKNGEFRFSNTNLHEVMKQFAPLSMGWCINCHRNTEVKFAEELDVHGEVSVFAKLPKGFFIATPVGKYNPDWAIVFEKEQVKHIYFIAETKGKMQSMQLRGIEKAKAECAEKHFDLISDGAVRYGIVDTYEHLIEIVGRT